MNKFSRLNEALDFVVRGETVNDRLTRARVISENDSTFLQYLSLATDPKKRFEGLPEGVPKEYKPKHDVPEGVSETVLKTELRRVKNFQAGGSVQGIPESKRINLWIDILEGLHWKEALLITAIKDGELLKEYPFLSECLDIVSLPPKVEEANVVADPKKGRGKGKAKTDANASN